MENKPKTSSYKRLKPYIKGFQVPFVLAIVGAIISAVITVIGPDKLKEITNTITEGITPTKMGVIPGIDLDKVGSIALTLAVLYAISAIVGYLQSFTVATVTQRFSQRFRTAIQKKINSVPLNYFDSHSQGDTLSRVTNDVDLLGQSLSQGLGTLITSSVLLVAAIIMMFYSNVTMAFTAIGSVLIGFVLVAFIMGFSQPLFKRQQENLANINGYIEEIDKIEKPITIVWYGDHLPGIYKEQDLAKYPLLYRETDYFVYNNKYAQQQRKLPNYSLVSPYMFSSLALEQANIKVTPFYALLTAVTNNLPATTIDPNSGSQNVQNGKKVFASDQNKTTEEKDLTKEQKELLHDYELIQYDLVAGKQYSADWAEKKVN